MTHHNSCGMRLLILNLLVSIRFVQAQSTSKQLSAILDSRLQSPEVVTFQLREYLMDRGAKLPTPTSAEQWTATAQRLRKHLVEDIVFRGWPQEKKSVVDSDRPSHGRRRRVIGVVGGETLADLAAGPVKVLIGAAVGSTISGTPTGFPLMWLLRHPSNKADGVTAASAEIPIA